MEKLSYETSYLVSSVVCLPFINEPPSKLTTLNTALNYALSETRKLKQKTCFVTFDQPLYQKSRMIVAESQNRGLLPNVVVRLGGFHLLMSYLGAIGYVMSGSGIEELWATVYAADSVKKMLTGHAFSRSMRAHILTFTAIGVMMCNSMTSDKTEEYRNYITSFFANWESEPPTIGDCQAEPSIATITEDYIAEIKKNGKQWPNCTTVGPIFSTSYCCIAICRS